MAELLWDIFPWIALLIFFILVKWYLWVTRVRIILFNGERIEPPVQDGLFGLLLFALFLAAAICIVLNNGF